MRPKCIPRYCQRSQFELVPSLANDIGIKTFTSGKAERKSRLSSTLGLSGRRTSSTTTGRVQAVAAQDFRRSYRPPLPTSRSGSVSRGHFADDFAAVDAGSQLAIKLIITTPLEAATPHIALARPSQSFAANVACSLQSTTLHQFILGGSEQQRNLLVTNGFR